MPRLAWDDRALDDLDAIATYIGADSPRAAHRVVDYIKRTALMLESFPEIGVASSEPWLREFILTRYPYILAYEVADDEVRILAVFHQSQQRR